MESNLRSWILGLVIGFMFCFLLFGIHILPQIEWTWEFDEPIEMSGGLASPILIILPEGEMYYVTTYRQETDCTYIMDGYHRLDVGEWEPLNNVKIPIDFPNYKFVTMPYYQTVSDFLRYVD